MTIDYKKILKKNITNVLKEVLLNIETKGLIKGHHLYITFFTNHTKVFIPEWLKVKYPIKMTIVIQYEYYNLQVKENDFSIELKFNNVKTVLKIDFDSIISFADPFANFGLKLINEEFAKNNDLQNNESDNVIDFKTFKKN